MTRTSDVFFDTSGWVAVVDKRDALHEKFDSFYVKLITKGGTVVTTDYVLAETFTLIRRRLGPHVLLSFSNAILKGITSHKIKLERVSEQRFWHAWKMMYKYEEKLDVSFFDLTSFVVMLELRLKKVFTGDRDFEKVNLGFKLVP
jgi:predicted nucleic acid-binding protein